MPVTPAGLYEHDGIASPPCHNIDFRVAASRGELLPGKLFVWTDLFGIRDAFVAKRLKDVDRERPESVPGRVVKLKAGDVWMPPICGNFVAQIATMDAKLTRQEVGGWRVADCV